MDAVREWPQILGFSNGATVTEELVDKQFRRMAKRYHPDAGGTTEQMQQLNLAKELALKWIEAERVRQTQLQTVQAHLSELQSLSSQMYQASVQQQNAYASYWSNAAQSQANSWGNVWSNTAANPVETPIEPKNRTWREKLRSWFS